MNEKIFEIVHVMVDVVVVERRQQPEENIKFVCKMMKKKRIGDFTQKASKLTGNDK